MAFTFSLDERSRLRRSQKQDGVLSGDARSASPDNRRKTTANAAGVSAQGHDAVAIGQGIRHYLKKFSKMRMAILRTLITYLAISVFPSVF